MNDNNILRLMRMSGELDSLFHEAAFRLGQSDSSMKILYIVFTNGGRCELSEVCSHSGIRKQTINSALRKLEKDNFIQLKKTDTKHKTVILTETGRQIS